MTENNDKYILQSVSNALDILDILADKKDLTVPEISEISGLGKSSVFRLLATLESKNYVSKSSEAKYSLDVKLAYLAQAVMDQDNLIKYGHPHLELLSHASGETSHMGILYQSFYVRFIDKVVSQATIHMDSRQGFSRYAHLVACGKILLANSSKDIIESYLENVPLELLTKNSITSSEELVKELQQVKQNGYAYDREESEYGLSCIAAPIIDQNNLVIAAISISGPSNRMNENIEKNRALVINAAKKISNSINAAVSSKCK